MNSKSCNKILNLIIAASRLPSEIHGGLKSATGVTFNQVRHLSVICRADRRQHQQQHYHGKGKRELLTRQLVVKQQCRYQTNNITGTTQVLKPYVDPKLSYAFGRSQEHLLYSTTARELDRQVEAWPDEIAFISHYENISVTFRQFNEDVNRLAKAMVTKFGVCKGDFVGVFAYNCYNWILIQYACCRVGAVLTPINPSYKADELTYILEHGKIKLLFMPGYKSIQRELNDHQKIMSSQFVLDLFRNKSNINSGGAGAGVQLESVVILDDAAKGESGCYSPSELEAAYPLAKWCKFYDWRAATAGTDGRVFRSAREADEAGVNLDDACILSPELVSPDDPFAVYYTSGTTGKPKGACVSQFTVLNNVRMAQFRLRHTRARNWKVISASTLPMFHIFAGVLNALSPITNNTTMVMSSYKYDIAMLVECITRHKANVTTVTPTMLIDMLTYIEQNPQLAEVPLKIVQPGGAMLPPELVARCFRILPHLEEVRVGYGSTENGSVASFQTIHEPDATRASTVGPPLDLTEIRVVDPLSADGPDAQLVPLGERGEIQTRGYNTMIQYLNDPAKTSEVITPNRWYRTGDIGLMHPHGSIEISGRLKHMIIKGGENIYPEEVEQMMHKMECIEKAHVVGVPDKRFGEQVCAWVKLQPGYVGSGGDYHEPVPASVNRDDTGEAATSGSSGAQAAKVITKEQVIEFCREHITYFKVPKYLFFVQDFPMTPTKKVQNHKMVERSIRILELEDEMIKK